MSNETLYEHLLSDEQVEVFHDQGFVVCRGFIPLDMAEELRVGLRCGDAWRNRVLERPLGAGKDPAIRYAQ